jgi:intracellular multiplication protein IcmJ
MKLLPIKLGVTRVSSLERASSFFSHPVDESAARTAIFKRDGYCCRFCGFISAKYQQLHFLSGDRRDWRPENLVTSCIFCEQCFTLERVAAMRSGHLIWLPEFSQAAVNHIARAIFIASISPGPTAEAAKTALSILRDRREDAKRRLGTDDPATLTVALQDYLEDDDYEIRHKKLDGVRLLPADRRIVHEGDIEFNQFPQILAYWRSKDGPFHGALPATWGQKFADLVAVAA